MSGRKLCRYSAKPELPPSRRFPLALLRSGVEIQNGSSPPDVEHILLYQRRVGLLPRPPRSGRWRSLGGKGGPGQGAPYERALSHEVRECGAFTDRKVRPAQGSMSCSGLKMLT